MKTKDGKHVEIIEDEEEPLEELIDKKGNRIPRKKKIKNEDGKIEEVEEVIDEE